jgi:uncharacterized membrane protein YccC
VVEAHAFILEVRHAMLRLHAVVKENLEASHVEAVFRMIFTQLVAEIEKFYATINTESKFAKKRVRVDLIQIQKCVSKDQGSAQVMVFEADTCAIIDQKVKSIIQTKCGGAQEPTNE